MAEFVGFEMHLEFEIYLLENLIIDYLNRNSNASSYNTSLTL